MHAVANPEAKTDAKQDSGTAAQQPAQTAAKTVVAPAAWPFPTSSRP
jgi:hypothetical protein